MKTNRQTTADLTHPSADKGSNAYGAEDQSFGSAKRVSTVRLNGKNPSAAQAFGDASAGFEDENYGSEDENSEYDGDDDDDDDDSSIRYMCHESESDEYDSELEQRLRDIFTTQLDPAPNDPDEDKYFPPAAQPKSPVYSGFMSGPITFTEHDFEPPDDDALVKLNAALNTIADPFPKPPTLPPNCEFVGQPGTKLSWGQKISTLWLNQDGPFPQGKFVPYGLLQDLNNILDNVDQGKARLDIVTDNCNYFQEKLRGIVDLYNGDTSGVDLSDINQLLADAVRSKDYEIEAAARIEAELQGVKEILKGAAYADGAWHTRKSCPVFFSPSASSKEHCPLCFCAGLLSVIAFDCFKSFPHAA